VPAGAPAGRRDPAAAADPDDPSRIAAWRITETRDPLGSLVRYEYQADRGDEPGHRWDQPLISRISYADYGDPAAPSFLVQIEFDYEARPDAFSTYRSGFEIRTSLRCRTIRVVTHAADGWRGPCGIPARVRAGTVQRRLPADRGPAGRHRRFGPAPVEEPMAPLSFGTRRSNRPDAGSNR